MSTNPNKNLLQMCNSISQQVIGEDALSDGTRPSKAMLIEMINDRQRDLARLHNDWTWLNAKVDELGYSLPSGATNVSTQTPTAPGTTGVAYPPAAGYGYIASKLVITTPTVPTSVTIPICKITTGAGEYYGNMYVSICPIVNGAPDLANPRVSSFIVNPYRPKDTLNIYQSFTFNVTSASQNLLAGEYYIVLYVLASAYSGVPIVPGVITGSGGGIYKSNPAASWVAGDAMCYSFYGKAGTYYTAILPISDTWTYIKSLKSNNGTILLPAANPHNGQTPPSGYFWMDSIDTDGTMNLAINSPDTASAIWTIDGKSKPLDAVADIDTLQVPADSRNLIEVGVILDCLAMNLTINSNVNAQLLAAKWERGVMDLEFTYREMQQDFFIEDSIYTSNVIDISSHNPIPDYKSPNKWR